MIVIGKTESQQVGFDLATLIDTRLLIQSNSGGGKSHTIRKLLETSHGKVQQIVLDLEGEFNTLREKFDYVLAGKGGDTATDPRSAGLLARRLQELGVSAICDLYELKAHERIRFVRLFLESLVSAPKSLWHPVMVVVDEAHHFCPQQGQAESAAAVIDLITRGRKRGLCGVLATQRLSKLHKDACAELLNVMVGRVSLDIDQKRAADVLGLSERDQRIALRDLSPGEFHCYGPGLRVEGREKGGVILIRVGSVVTTHPKVGQRRIEAPPAPTSAIKKVLGKLADLPAEAEDKAKTEADLRREIATLKRELTVHGRSQPKPIVDTKEIEKWQQRVSAAESKLSESRKSVAFIQKRLRRLTTGFISASQELPEILKLLENHQPDNQSRPIPTKLPAVRSERTVVKPQQVTSVQIGNGRLSKAQQRILNTLAIYEAVGLELVAKNAVAAYAGVSPTSGGYFNNLGVLRTLGLVEYPSGGMVSLTDEGRQVANPAKIPATLGDLHQGWLAVVTKSQASILEVLIEIYPNDIDKNELAEQIGVSPTSGGYFNNLGRLRTLGAAEYPTPRRIKATNLVFPEGLA